MATVTAIIMSVLGMISAVPAVAKPLAVIVALLVPIGAAVTALVAILHAVVLTMEALAKIPGLAKLQSVADTLSADVDVAGNFVNNDIAPFVQQLSMLPLPKNAPPVAVAPAA